MFDRPPRNITPKQRQMLRLQDNKSVAIKERQLAQDRYDSARKRLEGQAPLTLTQRAKNRALKDAITQLKTEKQLLDKKDLAGLQSVLQIEIDDANARIDIYHDDFKFAGLTPWMQRQGIKLPEDWDDQVIRGVDADGCARDPKGKDACCLGRNIKALELLIRWNEDRRKKGVVPLRVRLDTMPYAILLANRLADPVNRRASQVLDGLPYDRIARDEGTLPDDDAYELEKDMLIYDGNYQAVSVAQSGQTPGLHQDVTVMLYHRVATPKDMPPEVLLARVLDYRDSLNAMATGFRTSLTEAKSRKNLLGQCWRRQDYSRMENMYVTQIDMKENELAENDDQAARRNRERFRMTMERAKLDKAAAQRTIAYYDKLIQEMLAQDPELMCDPKTFGPDSTFSL